tara:strand:+ start:144 stop:359 length:216 start_codon:yes stop_codon:yes gene_type:complete
MIYLLKRLEDIGWDEYAAKVVRAESEKEARALANQNVGDEGKIWEYSTCVSCEEVDTQEYSAVILQSYKAG